MTQVLTDALWLLAGEQTVLQKVERRVEPVQDRVGEVGPGWSQRKGCEEMLPFHENTSPHSIILILVLLEVTFPCEITDNKHE